MEKFVALSNSMNSALSQLMSTANEIDDFQTLQAVDTVGAEWKSFLGNDDGKRKFVDNLMEQLIEKKEMVMKAIGPNPDLMWIRWSQSIDHVARTSEIGDLPALLPPIDAIDFPTTESDFDSIQYEKELEQEIEDQMKALIASYAASTASMDKELTENTVSLYTKDGVPNVGKANKARNSLFEATRVDGQNDVRSALTVAQSNIEEVKVQGPRRYNSKFAMNQLKESLEKKGRETLELKAMLIKKDRELESVYRKLKGYRSKEDGVVKMQTLDRCGNNKRDTTRNVISNFVQKQSVSDLNMEEECYQQCRWSCDRRHPFKPDLDRRRRHKMQWTAWRSRLQSVGRFGCGQRYGGRIRTESIPDLIGCRRPGTGREKVSGCVRPTKHTLNAHHDAESRP